MIPAAERILDRISDAELKRRWAAARKAMAEHKVDALVLQNTSDWIGGYVRWFTDLPATNGYPRSVVFGADDMSVIEMGPFGVVRDYQGKDDLHRGVGQHLLTPSFTSIAYTNQYDAELAVEVIKNRGYKTIGFITPNSLPHGFIGTIKSKLDGQVKFTDASEWIDRIKAIKSPEEIALIRRCATMQDEIFAQALKFIKPGVRDIDVTSLAQHEGQIRGSEQGIFLGASSPVGIRSSFMPRFMQGRTLKTGDHLSLLIEVNGPGGMYTEIARTIVLGKASNELLEGFAAVREAQTHTLSLIKPGVKASEVAAAHDAYMTQRGMPAELRLYAHGQGYDMVERPLIRRDENMTFEAGMNLAVHPGYETPSIFAVICDNYMVEQNGPGECLHKTEKKVFEV
jgi:Xaa-Pro aminopeptidase